MFKTWMLAVAGLVAFAVLVWVAGPLVVIGGQAPLASTPARLVVIGVFTLQYLAQKLWRLQQAKRRNEQVLSALAPAADPGLSAEAAQLRERFSTALAELRQARFTQRGWSFGRSYLYQLPWYLIIGAPGTGKTTALLNSGLEFPLARKLGRGAVGGFGGTRNCDWWFTDRAVLIDTAGRYTTQDSDRTTDRKGWDAFLGLLQDSRPRRPLDGLLVAVSISDLIDFTPQQVVEHARILRARVADLQSTLRVRMPVYLLLTKCDLLPGFVDWFGSLARSERDEPLGVTFDPAVPQSTAVAQFGDHFERLIESLSAGLIDRLQQERDLQRRARIVALPAQLRALNTSLTTLVGEAFAAHATMTLRGVYLTSGTQDGTPIDRMLAAFGAQLGLGKQILPPNQSTGKSFFLAGLLNDIVFAEAGSDARPRAAIRRRRALIIGASTMALLAAIVLAAWLQSDYARANAALNQLDAAVSRARTVVDAIPPAAKADPRALLPALNSLRSLAIAAQASPNPPWLDIAARSRSKVAAATQQAYERLLLGPFQAQIASAIDSTMRTGADANVQYEALKAYRMLTDPRHFDAAGLKVFVMSYYDASLGQHMSSSERKDLRGHLDAFLRAGAVGSGIKLEPALLSSVQERLTSQSVSQRIELRLGVLFDSAPGTDLTLTTSALFVGGDGKSAPKSVPWRYTLAAYETVVIKQVPQIAEQLAAESKWVLGVPGASASSDITEVMTRYRRQYARAWLDALEDLHLQPAKNNKDAIQQAQALGDPHGALAAVLNTVAQQTPFKTPDGAAGPITPTEPDAEQLAALTVFLRRDGLQAFRDVSVLRSPTGTIPEPAQKLAQVRNAANQQPVPIRTMLSALAVLPEEVEIAQEGKLTGRALSQRISATLGLACIRLVGGHFPFDRRAAADASLEDFSRLFAPRGAFDQTFTRLLSGRVSAGDDSWEWRGPGAAPPAQDLERFRAAALVRTAFFPHGGNQPGFKLTFRPIDLDEGIDRFQLEIDGQTVRYAHGPVVDTTVTWPGPQAKGHVRIETTPAGSGAPLEFNGPWALFRLLDVAAIKAADSPGQFEVVFNLAGGRHASFHVVTDNGVNPFRLRELEHFDCPLPGGS
jgi:type VI secretion system protein ImpL